MRGCEDRIDRSENGCDAGELSVEVGGVSRRFDGWFVWWSDSLVVDIIPVDVLKEGMGHDLLRISWPGTKTMLRFSCEELRGQLA
jgi:hypothetical protein